MRTCVNATLDGVLSGDAHNPRTFYLSEESNEHKNRPCRILENILGFCYIGNIHKLYREWKI